jgi:hypothetical protein
VKGGQLPSGPVGIRRTTTAADGRGSHQNTCHDLFIPEGNDWIDA